jgi:hypothetical protein
VNAQNFQRLPGEREKFRRHENQAQGNLRREELGAQILRPPPQAGFIEPTRPVRRDGKFIVHESTIAPARTNVNAKRMKSSAGFRKNTI